MCIRDRTYLVLHFPLQVGRVSLHLLSPLFGRFKDQLYKRPTPELGGGESVGTGRGRAGQGEETGAFHKLTRLVVTCVYVAFA